MLQPAGPKGSDSSLLSLVRQEDGVGKLPPRGLGSHRLLTPGQEPANPQHGRLWVGRRCRRCRFKQGERAWEN